MSDAPRIRAVATAVPPHRLPQSELRDFASRFFARDFPALPRLLRVFDNAGIAERQLARPVPWYETPRSFPDKNAVYVEQALALSERAAAQALARANVPAASLGAIVFVSSTGVATPSLDSVLVQRLDLPRGIARVPLWGLGCAGGAAGVARAATLCRGLRRPVLLVSVEICSVTLVHEDRSKSNLVATALFGDGAAAAVLTPDGEGPAVLGGFSHLLDDTADVMGWTLRETGLQVRFARSIPAIVRAHAPQVVDAALHAHGIDREQLAHVVMHPGGAKVLAAYEQALGLAPDALDHARAVLRDHGNMSSPTVLFVLERWLRSTPPSPSHKAEPGVLMGLGPGFCAEGVVLRW
ncbi:MAG: 3-oxoacyl-[acyl-carrier-protein] synthase III C-terminal domain-containing protein [Myxococcota bacterium]